MRARLAALAAALLLTGGAAGCGEQPSEPRVAPRLMSAGEVASLPPGSPQRAVAGWWRALQTGNSRGAAELLPVASRRSLKAGLPVLATIAKPVRLKIVSVERTGSRAVVYTELVAAGLLGRSRMIEAPPFPQAFAVALQDGHWRLRDGSFLLRVGRRLIDSRTSS